MKLQGYIEAAKNVCVTFFVILWWSINKYTKKEKKANPPSCSLLIQESLFLTFDTEFKNNSSRNRFKVTEVIKHCVFSIKIIKTNQKWFIG